MYSICSAPSDSNPDWCQRLLIILFAPHPFCAAFTASIPSYSTVTPNVTLFHPPSLQLLLWDFRDNVCWNYKVGRNHECRREQRDLLCSFLFSHFLPHVFSLLYTQASDYNIFEGLECRGGPALVLSRGRVVYEEGTLQVQQGSGRFIPRKQFPDYAYQRVKCRNQVSYTQISAAWAELFCKSVYLDAYFYYFVLKEQQHYNIC